MFACLHRAGVAHCSIRNAPRGMSPLSLALGSGRDPLPLSAEACRTRCAASSSTRGVMSQKVSFSTTCEGMSLW